MPRRFFTRISAQYKAKTEHPWYVKPFAYLLTHPVYFSASRRSVAGGLWIGLFLGLIPLPFHSVLAVFMALWLRVNIPVAAVAVWITNPITVVPIYYLAYRLGAAILNVPVEMFPIDFTFSWSDLNLGQAADGLSEIGKPLIVGCLSLAVSIASAGYFLVSVVWRISTLYRYRRRHRKARLPA